MSGCCHLNYFLSRCGLLKHSFLSSARLQFEAIKRGGASGLTSGLCSWLLEKVYGWGLYPMSPPWLITTALTLAPDDITTTGRWHSYQEYYSSVFPHREEVEIGDHFMEHPVDLRNNKKHGIPSPFLNMLYFSRFHAKYSQIHPTWPQNAFLINTIKLLCILLFLSLRWIITFKLTLSYSLFCPRCQIKL